MIAVVIVDDEERVRKPLEILLDGMPGMVCVGTFPDAESFLLSKLDRVDVVLLDIGLPGMSGIEAIEPISRRWPRADVLIQTVYQDENRVFEALCAGATGYLLKNTPPVQIIEAIHEVQAGGAPMTPGIARKVVRLLHKPDYKEETLTGRENEVLERLIQGKTNHEIAEDLFVTTNTIGFHCKQIYKKLHVHSRAEAVAKAMKRRR